MNWIATYSNNPLYKEFYEIGKDEINCNIPECFENFYYYYRFGYMIKRALRVYIIHKLILLDKIISINVIGVFPIELRNSIYYYFLNLSQCDWIQNIKSNIDYMCDGYNELLDNIKYFDDHKTNPLIKNLFGHCKGKSCHVNSFRGYACDSCGEFYCGNCKDKYLSENLNFIKTCRKCLLS